MIEGALLRTKILTNTVTTIGITNTYPHNKHKKFVKSFENTNQGDNAIKLIIFRGQCGTRGYTTIYYKMIIHIKRSSLFLFYNEGS
jgi:hypothetical protein